MPFRQTRRWFRRFRRKTEPPRAPDEAGNDDSSDYVVFRASDWPIYPPPPPSAIIANLPVYRDRLAAIRFAHPRGILEDCPLFSLYRLYEYFLLDQVIGYRNQLEYFWRQKTWPVKDIPDPRDDDPERYAFLAGCTFLIVRSFNERVRLGLDRQMRGILMDYEVEMLLNRPDHLRTYESAPEWAMNVAPLADTLVVPTNDGEVLSGWDDPRANAEFRTKNILLWTPAIFFT